MAHSSFAYETLWIILMQQMEILYASARNWTHVKEHRYSELCAHKMWQVFNHTYGETFLCAF
jgi:hypothetical protein